MASKPLKPCAQHGCPNLTRNRYCDTHQQQQQADKRVTNQHYDKYQRDRRSTLFYRSGAWRKLRTYIYNKQHGLCQRCLQRGKVVRADVVHHIEEIKEAWDKRLDEDNLECLCHDCHNKEHGHSLNR
jgi:5-methylcytosine-specific restriction enzyme A